MLQSAKKIGAQMRSKWVFDCSKMTISEIRAEYAKSVETLIRMGGYVSPTDGSFHYPKGQWILNNPDVPQDKPLHEINYENMCRMKSEHKDIGVQSLTISTYS